MTKLTYDVTAKRWKHGWELHIEGVGVTQSRSLLDAEDMARDYISLLLEVPEESIGVRVMPEIGAGVDGEILSLYETDRLVEKATKEAASKRRSIAASLAGMGLSGREIAAVLKVSPTRVSQLLRGFGRVSR